MKKLLRPIPIIAIVLLISVIFIYIKSCCQCVIWGSPMDIPAWVTYPIEFRNIRGVIQKRNCPANWPWSEKKRTIEFAIVDDNERYFLDWQVFNNSVSHVRVEIRWDSSEQFNVFFIQGVFGTDRLPFEAKLLEKNPGVVLIVTYAYSPLEKKYKLIEMAKGESGLVKKAE